MQSLYIFAVRTNQLLVLLILVGALWGWWGLVGFCLPILLLCVLVTGLLDVLT